MHKLSDILEEGTVVLENPSYEDAITGLTHDGRLVYDFDKMVECLVKDGMEVEEAIEFIDFNTVRSLPYMGDKAPVIHYAVEK